MGEGCRAGALGFDGDEFDEVLVFCIPMFEEAFGFVASCLFEVFEEQATDSVFVFLGERLRGDVSCVVVGGFGFVYKDSTTCHTCAEVGGTVSEDHDVSVSHVLTSVIACSLDDGCCATVSDGEARTGRALTIESLST